MGCQFEQILSGSNLPNQSLRELVESGFVLIPDSIRSDRLVELTAAYDDANGAGIRARF